MIHVRNRHGLVGQVSDPEIWEKRHCKTNPVDLSWGKWRWGSRSGARTRVLVIRTRHAVTTVMSVHRSTPAPSSRTNLKPRSLRQKGRWVMALPAPSSRTTRRPQGRSFSRILAWLIVTPNHLERRPPPPPRWATRATVEVLVLRSARQGNKEINPTRSGYTLLEMDRLLST